MSQKTFKGICPCGVRVTFLRKSKNELIGVLFSSLSKSEKIDIINHTTRLYYPERHETHSCEFTNNKPIIKGE